MPAEHNGGRLFSFEIRFSEEFKGLRLTAFEAGALEVTGGRLVDVKRTTRGENRSVTARVRPASSADVTVSLAATTDCSASTAICTRDGRMLSNSPSATVSGPPNTAATGAATITGTAQVGETLTADTSGISDADGLDNAVFSYQWLADDADISGATGSTYTLAAADEGKAVKVRVSFTDDAGNDESLTSEATVTAAPLTVSIENEATSHDGSGSFIFELRFSEEVKVGYESLRDHVFTVTGGTVTKAQRLDKPSNIRWQITVQPDSNADVTVVLPVTTDCDAQGAICTKIGGRPLSNTVSVTVQGPAENSLLPAGDHSRAARWGTLRQALRAFPAPRPDGATFSYQWQADDADISGATGNSYTLVIFDEGKAVKVRVSFTDDAGHAETLTSAATAAVAAATPPAVSSIEVDGATVAVTFDEDLAPVSSVETLHLYWTILGTAVDQHPNRASVSGRTVTLEIGTPAVAGQTITVRYGWSGHLKDADGNAVESFSVTATNLTQ